MTKSTVASSSPNFSLEAGVIPTISGILSLCSGCTRSRPRFYMARLGPRYVGKQLGNNAWNRVSFDEIGPVLISCGPGTRKMCKVYFYIWTCLDSRAVCFVPSLRIKSFLSTVQFPKLSDSVSTYCCQKKYILLETYNYKRYLAGPSPLLSNVNSSPARPVYMTMHIIMISIFSKVN